MKPALLPSFLATIALSTSLLAHATADVTINPTSDGSLYVCSGCNVVSDGAYVLTAGYIQGAVKFSSAPIAGGHVTQAFLTLNPYGLPLWGNEVAVYGYGTTEGQLTVADADAGTYLGTLTLPPNLGYGQDAFFDVTAFVASTQAPYLAFNLRSEGSNVFSSLEYNYGHPAQLVVTVPEAGSTSLALGGLLLVGLLGAARRNTLR